MLRQFSCFLLTQLHSPLLHMPYSAKMRTKLPNLLAKTMSIRRRNHTTTTTHDDDDSTGSSTSVVGTRRKKKISAISGTKNVCSILRNALTSKKSSSSSEGDDRVCSINTCDDESEECSVERELLLEEKRNGSSFIKWEQQNVDNKISLQQKVSPANMKPPTKASLSFSGFLNKKVLNKATSASLTRVPSMRFKSFRRTRSTRKDTITQDEPEREAERTDRREELCKKRILMGGKCRPLNVSGALHYDSDGILLPEEILSCDDEDY